MVETVLFRKGRGDRLALFDADGSDQNRPAGCTYLVDIVDDGIEFFLDRFVDQVILIIANTRLVGGDNDDVEIVDIHELIGFGGGCSGHPADLAIELKEVLKRNGGKGLALFLDLDIFLRLDRLMEAVGPLPAVHQPPGKLVDNDNLAVDDNVVLLLFKGYMRPQTLLEHVRPFHIGAGEKRT